LLNFLRNYYIILKMKKAEIQNIIVKFLNKEANIHELEKLEIWLKKEQNTSLFNRFVRIHYIVAQHMTEYDLDKAKKSIQLKLDKGERKKRLVLYRRMGVAAAVLLMFGGTLFNFYNTKQPQNIINKETIVIEAGSDKAILTLGNGNQVALEKGKTYQSEDVHSNGEELVYNTKSKNNKEEEITIYNYLTIPRGGEFFLKLADGTEVWLNSESKLKYPIQFKEGKTRKVELVYGEAYFKVSPSTAHKGVSFNVQTKFQEVSVLGTQFDIKAYNDEDVVSTTLIEGKVQIEKGANKIVLKPNQQSKVEGNTNEINIFEVDVSEEISWVHGLFTFNEAPLNELMRILARWYDVDVLFETAAHKDFVFTGILERTKSIEDILILIQATSEGQIKIEVNEKTITIK